MRWFITSHPMFSTVTSRLLADFRYIERDSPCVEIGKGAFGVVYGGIRKAHHGPARHWEEMSVAIKVITPDMEDGFSNDLSNTFLKEMEMMAKIRHLACLPLVAWSFAGGAQFTLVSPRMESDLEKLLAKARHGLAPSNFTNEARSIIALGMAAGLKHLHSKGIVHCDVKPANILLDTELRPQICDFGLSHLLFTRICTKTGGTLVYMAPERLTGTGQPEPSCDVFAYGMVLYELFTERSLYPPEETHESIKKAVLAGDRPKFPERGDHLPRKLVQLIERCWAGDCAKRPTFEDIINERESLKVGGGDYFAFTQYWEDLKGSTQSK
jgi:serine/threonine protein kinase